MQKLIKLFVIASVSMLLSSCATTTAPIYPQLDEDSELSILMLDNRLSTSLMSPAPLLEVQLDGFSVTENKDVWGAQFLLKGVLEVKIPSGSHEIIHKGRTKSNGEAWYDPISTTFDVEAGQTYTIIFEYKRETMMKIGYALSYEGWLDEVTAQWPSKNICHSRLGT